MSEVTQKIWRFVLVGGTGFAVDAVILKAVLVGGFAGPVSARIFSISIAALLTWRLNRKITFQAGDDGQLSEGARYGSVVALSSVVNYLIYIGFLHAIPGLEPLIAMTGASVGAMILSYLGYDRFVFWNQRDKAHHTG